MENSASETPVPFVFCNNAMEIPNPPMNHSMFLQVLTNSLFSVHCSIKYREFYGHRTILPSAVLPYNLICMVRRTIGEPQKFDIDVDCVVILKLYANCLPCFGLHILDLALA